MWGTEFTAKTILGLGWPEIFFFGDFGESRKILVLFLSQFILVYPAGCKKTSLNWSLYYTALKCISATPGGLSPIRGRSICEVMTFFRGKKLAEFWWFFVATKVYIFSWKCTGRVVPSRKNCSESLPTFCGQFWHLSVNGLLVGKSHDF